MTSISRPRQSLLSLFDPLASTPELSTPPRNDSPSAESDKENENPPRNELTLTTFFNRTYKPPHTLPKPLRRRLVDVGDVTVDDVDPWESDEDGGSDILSIHGIEDNENDTLTFRQMAEAATPKFNYARRISSFKTPSPSAPRAPLSELSFDHDYDTTPLSRNRTVRKQPVSLRSKLTQVQSPEIVVSSASPQRQALHPKLLEHKAPFLEEDLGVPPVSPNPLLNSASSINLPSSSVAGSLITETVIPEIFTPSVSTYSEHSPPNSSRRYAHLRPHPPATSSLDQSRRSVDLQNSFQLHFGDDTNFDLLNDKVSFFNASKPEGGPYTDGDASFDLSFGDEIALHSNEVAEAPPGTKATLPMSFGLKQQCHDGHVTAVGKEYENPLPHSRPEVEGTAGVSGEQKVITPKHSKLSKPTPPPVMGLRIVKRTQFASQKPLRSAASSEVPVSRQSTAVVPKSPVRPSSKALEVPPLRRTASSLHSTAGAPQSRAVTVESERGGLARTTFNASSSLSRNGPRRVIVSDEVGKKSTSRTVGGENPLDGPRRIAVQVSERPSIPKGSKLGTGLKQPSSTGAAPKAPSRSIAGSSLPQPVSRSSRLPAPMHTARINSRPSSRETSRGLPTVRRIV